jgi:hypothetical protein
VTLIVIGVFLRGPGWMWFWPGQTWDHQRQVHEVGRNLHDLAGITSPLTAGIFGALAVGAYAAIFCWAFHQLFKKFNPRDYANMNFIQYAVIHVLMLSMMALPLKILLRLLFRIKYVWVTPWFNI